MKYSIIQFAYLSLIQVEVTDYLNKLLALRLHCYGGGNVFFCTFLDSAIFWVSSQFCVSFASAPSIGIPFIRCCVIMQCHYPTEFLNDINILAENHTIGTQRSHSQYHIRVDKVERIKRSLHKTPTLNAYVTG